MFIATAESLSTEAIEVGTYVSGKNYVVCLKIFMYNNVLSPKKCVGNKVCL